MIHDDGPDDGAIRSGGAQRAVLRVDLPIVHDLRIQPSESPIEQCVSSPTTPSQQRSGRVTERRKTTARTALPRKAGGQQAVGSAVITDCVLKESTSGY